MKKEVRLTGSDIKLIKYEKRTGYVFAAITLAFGALFNIIYLSGNDIKLNLLLVINFLILILAVFILKLINRQFVKDLREGVKIIKTEEVEDKIVNTDYEPGSGSLSMPILGALFPKYFGQEMKPIKKYKLKVNNFSYDVDESLFKTINKGDRVKMYYSKHSNLLLGIESFIYLCVIILNL